MRGSLPAMAFIGMLGLVPSAAALGLQPVENGTPGDPTPYSPNAIHARYNLGLKTSLDGFGVEIRLQVFEVELRGPAGVPAQAIRDAGPGVRQLFEDGVRDRVARELEAAFPGSRPLVSAVQFDYGASDADADPYRPAIEVVATADLPLSAALLGMPRSSESATDWARAFFYSGGSSRIERTLLVPPGFDAALRVQVPDGLRLASPGRNVGTSAEFTKNNMMGQAASPLYVRFEVGLLAEQVPQTVLDGPLVRATFYAEDVTPLWLQAVPFTSGRYAADLDLVIEIPSLSTGLFDHGLLPSNLALDHVSADLVRLAVRDGLVGEAELEGYFQAIIQSSLRAGFGPKVRVAMDSEAFRHSLDQPVGGPDVRPLIIRAYSRLPIESNHMLASSAIARSLGMITGTSGGFDLSNGGDWRLEVTLFYPKGADVESRDSLGRLTEVQSEGREGFRVYLAQGETTHVNVWGRPGFAFDVFAIGILELGVLVAGGLWLVRWSRSWIRTKSMHLRHPAE